LDEPLAHLDAFGREQAGLLLRCIDRPEEGCLGFNFSTISIILQELGEEIFDCRKLLNQLVRVECL